MTTPHSRPSRRADRAAALLLAALGVGCVAAAGRAVWILTSPDRLKNALAIVVIASGIFSLLGAIVCFALARRLRAWSNE
jgi:hypothetical protein